MSDSAFSGWASPLPPSLAYSLDGFARKPPLWPVSPGTWHAIVDDVRRFANRWHAVAASHGWTVEQLYGWHPDAPHRTSELGAGWLIAKCGHHVIDVDREAITLKTQSGATLRIYRTAKTTIAR